jgi:hypothetical protein
MTEGSPQRTRSADSESLHSARERAPVVSLDDQVQVIALDRHVYDPKIGRVEEHREHAMDHTVDGAVSQLEPIEAQRHVNRMVLRELGPRAMRTTAPNGPLATRAVARGVFRRETRPADPS